MTKLPENQERVLRSSLFVIENHLQRIKSALEDGNHTEQTIIYRRRDNLNSDSKPKIIGTITEMLNEIKQMKETFRLGTKEIQLRAEIYAKLTESWIILVDLRPERLKAYGQLLESDKALIEIHVISLLNKLDKLLNLL
jgi:hypothetical protein